MLVDHLLELVNQGPRSELPERAQVSGRSLLDQLLLRLPFCALRSKRPAART